MIEDRERPDHGDAALERQLDQRLVEEDAVLDGVHAVLDREPRADAAVRVRGELQAMAVRGVGGTLHLARR